MSYTKRLKTLDLPTLKYRRFRGEIQVCKIINQIDGSKLIHFLLKLNQTQNTNCMLNTVQQMLESTPLAIELHQHGLHFR